MPLSEDEERILHEIEQQLHATDPQLVREVSSTTLYRHAGRNLKWAALGFVAGLVVLVIGFTASLLFGVVGFMAMLASAFVAERNLRAMGRAGWDSASSSLRVKGLGDSIDETRKKLQQRFKREG